MPILEIMINSPLIQDLIFKGKVHEIKEIMQKSKESGMQTFDTALAGYVINPAERAPDLHDLAGTVLGIEIEPSDEPGGGGAAAQGGALCALRVSGCGGAGGAVGGDLEADGGGAARRSALESPRRRPLAPPHGGLR